VSFRLPKTTTPVNAVDSTTPPGITINKFEILSVDGLPPGLYWQLNQSVFDPAVQTDGCIKICGTPLASDTFKLTVTLKATVFIISQISTFPMTLYIAPKQSVTEGFSMLNPTGCGSTTVEFTNKVPSNGNEGFSYTWDFGDGSPVSTAENPAPRTYDQPGMYEVKYRAIVDTSGYILESIRVLEVGCTDPPLFGNPDLFLEIRNPAGNLIFNSSPAINSTPLPYTFPVNMPLGEGNYSLTVWDDDGGIKGSDDVCGVLTFNYLSNGSLVAGSLKVVMNILHPVDTIWARDTVIVYPQPSNPTLSAPGGLSACTGADAPVLVSSYGFGNHWMLDGHLIPGATAFIYQAVESGSYQVQFISPYGCVAVSAPVTVSIYPLPQEPTWFNFNNMLQVVDTLALPTPYSLQWFNGNMPITGATGIRYCATQNGQYGLMVTDLSTGCTNTYTAQVNHNPNFDCTVGLNELAQGSLTLYPNPSGGQEIWLGTEQDLPAGAGIHIWDAAGRLARTYTTVQAAATQRLDLGQLTPGIYVLELRTAQGIGRAKLVVGK
jgi:hypothetical protein